MVVGASLLAAAGLLMLVVYTEAQVSVGEGIGPDGGGCPPADLSKECSPKDVIRNKCLVDIDCASGSSCCSNGCSLVCVKITKKENKKVCAVPVDLGFLIDASGSIGAKNFQKILQFVAKIVDAFDIRENGTHVGVIYYSDDAILQFDFNKFKNEELTRANIVTEINKISVTEGQTRIDLALQLAKEKLFSVEGGMRADKPKIALVMTDGRQTKGDDAPDAVDLHIASRPLKGLGVQVYSLGIGKNYDIGELLDIASDDASVFRSSDVDELVSIVASITEQTCKGCTNPVDIHFAIDSSANVGKEGFEMIRNFIKAVGYKFIISETGSHMSASVFGDDPMLIFDMSKAASQEAFLAEADGINYLGDSTANIDKALRFVSNDVFTLSGYTRQKAPKILVLITSSNCANCAEDLVTAVKPLKEAGVHIISIPVGKNVKMSEMDAISSLPSRQYVIPQNNFAELVNGLFIQTVSQMICSGKPGVCKEPPIPKNCERVIYKCDVDVDCPSGRKCCMKDCEQICEPLITACITPIDLTLAFETTKDGTDEFSKMKAFSTDLIDHFKIGRGDSHVSIATFSDTPGSLSRFNVVYDPAEIKKNIDNLKSDGGEKSNIGNFLQYVDKEIFSLNSGLRQSTPRVLVIFTKGNFPKEQESIAKAEANRLKSEGKDVQIIVVNVGTASQEAVLKSIASEPAGAKLINVQNIGDLQSNEMKQRVAEEVCSTKSRTRQCGEKFATICSVHDNLCSTDFDCPGTEECVSDGCRFKCTSCREGCKDKLDLLLILDNSKNIGEKGFKNTKTFIKTMLEWFNVDQNGTNIAVMTYSNDAKLHMPLPFKGSNSPSQTLFDIQGRLDSVPYSGGSEARLDRALSLAAAQVFPPGAKSREAKKAVIVLTDGESDASTKRLDIASWPLRSQKKTVGLNSTYNLIRIMAISVGGKLNLGKLENVVTPPLQDNVFLAANFDDIYVQMKKLAAESCTYTAGELLPPIELIPGDPGPPGPKGPKGEPGPNGMSGPDGEAGPKGDPGTNGAKGQKGEVGPPGGTGSVDGAGDLKGPDPLGSAVGAIEGEAVPGTGNIVYDMRKGPVGPPGIVGKVGSAGPAGDAGNPGRKGRAGPPGPRGYFGQSGQKGKPAQNGVPGPPGDNGALGSPGKQGPAGSQGIPGPQGPFGYKGEQGTAGAVGNIGDAGKVGAKGYPGEKGDQGDIGLAGFTGSEGPEGPVGSPGQRGLRGSDGPQGSIGEIGAPGNKGLPGPRGNQGVKGQSGIAGNRGEKGAVGEAGAQGQQGLSGAPGPAGPDGLPGAAGEDGPTGLPGPTGAMGPIGSRGPVGTTGEIGPVGADGPKGSAGEIGRRGLTGLKGETGGSGEVGPAGPQGQIGKQGNTGVAGPRGPPGSIGAQGLRGQPGDPGQAGSSGPKGNQGPQGETGPIGNKGSVGLTGVTGANGLVGDMGNVGRPGLPGRDGKHGQQGINGKDGDPGSSGPAGLQGLPGAVGVPGTSGDSGLAGDQGAPGAHGVKGSRGDTGARGSIGISGPPGAPGLRGERGDQGPQGTSGIQGPPGPAGSQGANGLDGLQGAKGSAGRPGNPGLVGEQGVPGAVGLPGSAGPAGRTGDRGETGSDGGPGEQGQPGLSGRAGARGREGIPGRPGTPGPTGSKGKTGLPGPKGQRGQDGNVGGRGKDGLIGPRGLAGARGEPGANGNPGLNGNPGARGEIGKIGKQGISGLPGPAGLRGPNGAHGPRGPKGPNGDRGDVGESGIIGVAGDIGSVGVRGASGERGGIGKIGVDGELGPQGIPGPQGTPGPAGPNGPDGPPGVPGKNGNKGPIGDPGDSGNPGTSGSQGPSGKDGISGSPGSPGKQGKTGVVGPVGPQGAPGEQGRRGRVGIQGSPGSVGPKGFAGRDGAPGLPGKRGPRGKEGPQGVPGATGRNGRDGKVGIDGTNGGPGAPGQQGNIGERGDSGTPGATGEAGEQGDAGVAGPDGPDGPRGANGSPGGPGTRGQRGEVGAKGNTGAAGIGGRDGSKGFKGQMGRYGIQGPAGEAGQKGADGHAGPMGHTGPQGNSGEPGPDGPDGSPGLKGPTGNGGQVGNEGYPGAPGNSGLPGTGGSSGSPGPPGPPGDMSGALSGNFYKYLNAGGGQKGPRRYRKKRSLDGDSQSNDIESLIKRNYDVFQTFDELWNKILNDIVVQKKLGSRQKPVITCSQLFRTNPLLKSGDYWIDPNEGATNDAILVHCNASNYETCIYPRMATFDKDDWYNGEERPMYAFKDLLNEETGIIYAAGIVQMKMIRLMSRSSRQNITYHCKNSHSNIRLQLDNNKDVNAHTNRETTVITDNCQMKDNKWHKSVFEMRSDKLEKFPIQDIIVKDIGGSGEEFGIDIGPVCFI